MSINFNKFLTGEFITCLDVLGNLLQENLARTVNIQS